MPALPWKPTPPGWLREAKFVSKSDARFLYEEVHVKRAYEQMGVVLRREEFIKSKSAILDIGANVGMFSTRAIEALGPLVSWHY